MPGSGSQSSDLPVARSLQAVRQTDAALAAVVEDLRAGRVSAEEAIVRIESLPVYQQRQWARWIRFAISRSGRRFGIELPAWPTVLLLMSLELIAYPIACAALRLIAARMPPEDRRRLPSWIPPFPLSRTLLTLATSDAPLCLSVHDGADGFHFSIE